MVLLNLNSKYDVKAELNVPYILVSHSIEEMNGDEGTYEVAVGVSAKDNKRIGFSGKALVSQFKELEKQAGNPYSYPVQVIITEAPAKKGGQPYRVIGSAELLDNE